ncbi:MAG TPA: hypothetical protein VFS97_14330 [Nitrososphaeraceae archaeon]|nr:hypothetical protein [Nitrososphaeraceae archaeon]
MAKFNFFIQGFINSAGAKMYLSELMSDMHTSLPMPMNMKPVEMFEVNVLEIEE